jgi:hypothetical protein
MQNKKNGASEILISFLPFALLLHATLAAPLSALAGFPPYPTHPLIFRGTNVLFT